MLHELEIENFRCFEKLTAKPLGRVNLLVGKNNSGKTAFLDAVELLAWDELTPPVLRSIVRREEYSWKLVDQGQGKIFNRFDLDVSNLFHGRSISTGSKFSIRNGERVVEVMLDPHGSERPMPHTSLRVNKSGLWSSLELTTNYLRRVEIAGHLEELFSRSRKEVLFLPTWRSDLVFLSKLWDEVLLTDEEALIVDCLRIVEPRVERLAFRGDADDRNAVLRLKGEKQPCWLGSLGDGMRHILALALHLASAKDGYLLIDEIDTGLHYTVLSKMWKMVIESARRLNIQVFATTHSMDCILALAEVHQQLELTPEDLMVHRLVAGMDKTQTYQPNDLVSVAQFQGEVR